MRYNKLLYYYQQELAFIRQISHKYALEHAKLADCLRENLANKDPHVERLIEAVSLSNARIRYKLAEEFPQTCNHLLQVLDPAFLETIPAMAIVQFHADIKSAIQPTWLPENTYLRNNKPAEYSCTFKTCYPIQLLPLVVQKAQLTSNKLNPLNLDHYKAQLELVLIAENEQVPLNKLALDSLRFFIHAKSPYCYALYDLLFQNLIAIGVALDDSLPVLIDKSHLRAVGFNKEQSMLPLHKGGFFGYQLLSDFFVLPEKFLFFDIVAIAKFLDKERILNSTRLKIYCYFNKANSLLEKNINAHCFMLNCAPVINLFKRYSEPVVLDHTKTAYLLSVSKEALLTAPEIHSVERVFAMDAAGQQTEYYPFYQQKNATKDHYYCLTPQVKYSPSLSIAHFLSFTDLVADKIIYAETYCSNGDLPARLAFASDQMKLAIVDCQWVKKVTVLTTMTACRRRPIAKNGLWRLIARLTFNHLSMVDEAADIEPLQNLLKLYAVDNAAKGSHMIEGLLALHSKPVYRRQTGVAQVDSLLLNGVEITLTVDETKFSETSLYLWGCVLARFFSLQATLNSFICLIIKNKQGEVFYSDKNAPYY
jgi:type VI secretion system protein ImpG